MKTIKILLVILFAGITFQGCIASLYPLYTAKDLVFDKRLLGTWVADSSTASWKLENLLEKELSFYKDPKERKDNAVFKKLFGNKNTYLLTCTDKGVKTEFLLNMIKLDNSFYVDLYPGPMKGENELLQDHYLPIHSYAKIKITDNGFELYFLNDFLLYQLLSENKIKIKHENLDSYKVITASTEELQKFVIKFADSKDFFFPPVKFKKSI
jgi:hypothetical protein